VNHYSEIFNPLYLTHYNRQFVITVMNLLLYVLLGVVETMKQQLTEAHSKVDRYKVCIYGTTVHLMIGSRNDESPVIAAV